MLSGLWRSELFGVEGETVARGFGMLLDRAHRGDEAGIEKRAEALAELLGDLFASALHVSLDGQAAGIAGGAVLRVESGKGRSDALRGVGDDEARVDAGLAAEFVEGFTRGGLH